MHRIYSYGFIGLLLLGGIAGCAAKEATPAGTPAQPEAHGDTHDATHETGSADASDVMVMERAAYERAKPVFDKYCADCHTTEKAQDPDDEALEHFNMDSYPFGGHHAHEIGEEIREVLGAEGDEPTMPMGDPGAVQGEELDLVLAWADAFDNAHGGDAEAHGHGEHGHGEHGHGEHGHGEHGHGEHHE